MAKRLVTFNQLGRYGRLGNQMFQIASTIGIARKNNFEYAFPYWKNHDHADRFGSKEDIDIQSHFVNRLPMLHDILEDRFIHWGYQNVILDRSCSLSGHMQSEKYFEHCKEEIRYFFKMQNEYQQNDYCAIHVRLGDYDNSYHPRLGMEYYAKAMNEFPSGTRFMIFSDDHNAVMQMFGGYKSTGNIDYSWRNYIDDFKFMKSCKHFIIGNSTYSWWPAWLGEHPDKIVVAPSNWFGAIANLSTKDLYAKNWIVI